MTREELENYVKSQIYTNHRHEVQAENTLSALIQMIRESASSMCEVKVDSIINALGEDKFWYGVEWDVNQANPGVTRIGNLELHKTLPIQNKMRGCLLADDGTVIKYLNADTWVDENTNGTLGQVMVELPDFYIRYETEGTTLRVKMSEIPLSGYIHIPTRYVSAYEAAVDRTTTTLCSVKNMDVRYRGGNNNASWDGTYRDLCGMPATAISMTNYRSYARKRGPGWIDYTYEVHKELYWLFVVEYSTRNSQKEFNSELSEEGYKQGGLGAGITNLDSTKWDGYNSRYPIVQCGYTDEIGNGTGIKAFSFNEEQQSAYGSAVTNYAIRYRGIENPFGHANKWVDGILVDVQSEAEGGESIVYECEDIDTFASTINGAYTLSGKEKRVSGYSREILFGDRGDIMTATATGAGSTTYYCDQSYASIPTTGKSTRAVSFGGSSYSGAAAGFVYSGTSNAPSTASASFGSRLCFYSKKNNQLNKIIHE